MPAASERLAYLPIHDRPRLVWPGGARVALWVVPNIEHYEYRPDPVRLRDPWPRTPHPDVLGYGLRDYGNRVGLWRMLEVTDRYDVRCTVSLNLAAWEHFPDVMAACQARGWDALCHGLYNTQYNWGLTEAEERAFIAECVATFRRLTGRPLRGWLSPANTNTVNTPDLLAEAGIRYYCDWFHDDQPFPMRVRAGSLLTMPYSMDLNDGWNLRGPMEAEEFADQVIAQFDQLYEDGAHSGRVMCLPLHPFVLGQPHRIGHLDRALRHVLSRTEVWQATGAEIAEWFTAHHLPALQARLTERGL
ncbi:MAG: polysaccharide deacetylase family protein [Janthinobacterium lividum]